MTLEDIMDAYTNLEAFRMVIPSHSNPTFKGKVVILTSNITASACEPLIDLLQKEKIATIVGRKTAGAMLSGNYFRISKELNLFLPISDYLTAEGKRIDKVGISPDISVNAEEALEYVLKNIF